MPHVDRTEVLARIDLADLATEICGPPVGRGRSARWHCPNPDHPDRHPSMNLYTSRQGHPRWKCQSCGEGGTAVDLLMISCKLNAGEALRELSTRAGLHPDGYARPVAPPRPTAHQAPTPRRTQPSPVIEQFVARAAELLWQPIGAGARRHLADRGLTEPILRANRVGFDPGPRHLPRPKGLPHRGPGIVFPALHATTGMAVYYQLRYLDSHIAATRKYDQPTADLAPNPRHALIRTPTPSRPDAVVVCEGFPDALTAAHTGLTAIAVLGVAHAGTDNAPQLAGELANVHPDAAFLITFDNDDRGNTAANKLAAHLTHHSRTVCRLAPPPELGDLNAWWKADPAALSRLMKESAPPGHRLLPNSHFPAIQHPTA